MAKMPTMMVKIEAKELESLIMKVNGLTYMINPMSETVKHNKQMIQKQQVILKGLTKLVKNHEFLLNPEILPNPFIDTPQESAAKRYRDNSTA